ncbi:TetR/AcrR family transcriptional regulator [Nocardiopsis trehalosi]|uniref:TetR/AcrR family transcriptional regulator n=1 Tax=Nocardiopsis trehalosi TaxID=109329 RepID=UPI00082A77EE|nr:TetR/AcrR family transcriptional regulator [Nocardiopsis trehalosi]
MNASTTRDRILDALQDLVIAEGPSAVTLEAVAAAAGVSKGGLLYHFPSKAAMMSGLVRRLADRAEDDFRAAAESDEGIVRHYLRTSQPESVEEAELYWSVIAALRGKDGTAGEDRGVIGGVFSEWGRLLHAEVPDPVLAEIIRLVGDGLYLSRIAGLPDADPDVVRRIIDRLAAEAEAARGR